MNFIKHAYYKLILSLSHIWYPLKYVNPYVVAKLHLAYQKYTETTMYRDRLICLGEDFAHNAFIEYREDKLFLAMLTRKEKLKAFFAPYSYINR